MRSQEGPRKRSHLLLVRLWADEATDGTSLWHSKVQHVVSGEARYFPGWPALEELLRSMELEQPDGTPATPSESEAQHEQ